MPTKTHRRFNLLLLFAAFTLMLGTTSCNKHFDCPAYNNKGTTRSAVSFSKGKKAYESANRGRRRKTSKRTQRRLFGKR